MSKIFLLLLISQFSIVLASGCAISRTRDNVDDNDASFEDNSANSGGRSTESDKESKSSSEDSEDSNSNTSNKSENTENKRDTESSGAGGAYDNPSSDSESDVSSARKETGGTVGNNETAGTEADPEDNDVGADDEPSFEDEFPELSCFDEECTNLIPLPDIICCTTGEALYSDAKDRCGLRLPPFPMVSDTGLDPEACVQLDRPGEIDSVCPEQQISIPLVPGPTVGCCTESGYCGGWSTEAALPFLRFGCYVNPSAEEPLVPCRLFETSEECRDVFAERGELTKSQACVCDHCLYKLKACRRNIGCVNIWECMLDSGCRDVDDCYLNPNAPCKEQFEQYDAVSLSYALRMSTCVRSNCD